MKRTQFLAGMSAVVLSLTFSAAWADKVANGDLIEFSGGTTALATEVNSNFSILRSAINSTDAQVQTLESDISDINTELSGLQPLISDDCPAGESVTGIKADGTLGCAKTVPVDTRVISMSAQGLSINSNREGDVFQRVSRGLRWEPVFSSSAVWATPKPTDYDGGDVTFSVWFSTTTEKSGYASFFIRPMSLSHGELVPFDSASISSDHVPVSGTTTLYEQSFTIPASILQGDLWEIILQRTGADSSSNPETYDKPVTLRAVAIEYSVVDQ
ncbi:hypothetical protein [Marinimicrobium sp. ABcell2]|uniref:hypothetical protein n=1 Tax=Marinimicrobium sp. ABcell2 TaxID=3069751 RepID=UPI0027AFD6CD|nr:hypothetical protein [Marinimicrobium sp. ABcell2]MDQ2077794.1 hypothetical protein [Marinimicrobium sp. ABcell2]